MKQTALTRCIITIISYHDDDDEDNYDNKHERQRKIISATTAVIQRCIICVSLWLIGTVRAEPETVISRGWVQSPDPAE